MDVEAYEQMERLREFDREQDGRDMDLREGLEFGILDPPELPCPMLTGIKINDEYVWAIKSRGSESFMRPGFTKRQNVFFFPIIPQGLPEMEVSGPGEWDVKFIGTVQDLLDSPFASRFEVPESVSRNEWLALISANHTLYGCKGQPYHQLFIHCDVISRVITTYANLVSGEGVPGDDSDRQLRTDSRVVYPEKYSALAGFATGR